MQTLAPPRPVGLETLSTPRDEQVSPGNAAGEEQDGKIGTGQSPGKEQEPLQGGGAAGDREEGAGSQGDGT